MSVYPPLLKTDAQLYHAADVSEATKQWFENNIIWSYFTSAYPWTRLGYTYDWAENSGEYGLTEFLVRPGTQVDVLYTDTIGEFISRLQLAK